MSRREELHEIFCDLLGSRNVYFQPPSTVKMTYPCIIYNRNTRNENRADDLLYNFMEGYTVTVVDRNPDSLIPGKVAQLPLCSFDRFYTADNLNHDVYTIYY